MQLFYSLKYFVMETYDSRFSKQLKKKNQEKPTFFPISKDIPVHHYF